MKPLTMILARARGGVIGYRGGLPWGRIPEDLRRFRAATMGRTCIAGRVTVETLPKLAADFGAEGFVEVSRETVGDVAFVEWRRR